MTGLEPAAKALTLSDFEKIHHVGHDAIHDVLSGHLVKWGVAVWALDPIRPELYLLVRSVS